MGRVVFDLLYPPRCGGCDRRDTLFCEQCRAQLLPADRGPHGVRGVRALICAGVFSGPLRAAIHNFKYASDRRLSGPMAGLIYQALKASTAWNNLSVTTPLLVPVPLHPAKEKARGYNQSLLLASDLAAMTGWTLDSRLVRIRETASQVGLDLQGRRKNVRDAFEWRGENAPERVVLIDDVCTTGATLSECAMALAGAGAKQIYVGTVARAAGLQRDVGA